MEVVLEEPELVLNRDEVDAGVAPKPRLSEVYCDYEAGLWGAIKEVFGPSVRVVGCVFHYTNAIWK